MTERMGRIVSEFRQYPRHADQNVVALRTHHIIIGYSAASAESRQQQMQQRERGALTTISACGQNTQHVHRAYI